MAVTRVDEPPAEATTERPNHRSAEFLLLVVGAEVCRHVDFPLRAVGVLFASAAVILGIRLLTRPAPPGQRRPRTLVLSLGMVAAATLLLWHVALLVVSPFFNDYERCLDQALTREAQQSCRDDLTERVNSWTGVQT